MHHTATYTLTCARLADHRAGGPASLPMAVGRPDCQIADQPTAQLADHLANQLVVWPTSWPTCRLASIDRMIVRSADGSIDRRILILDRLLGCPID